MGISVRNKTTGLLEPVASMPAVDGVLSADSTNPIANKAVYAALQEAFSVGGATDVELTTLTDGQVLKYDATSEKWVNGTGGTTIDELGDIEDVDLSNLTDGQTIVWDATNSKWVNGEGGKTYTAGYLINIDSEDEISGKVFVGTEAEWEALSSAEQAEYDMINITDDYKTTSDIEIIYVDNLPVTGIKDVIYGLINHSYSSAEVAEDFLDNVSGFTKDGYVYTSDTVEVSVDGINYSKFESLTWDGTDFTLAWTSTSSVAVAVGATFYWRSVTNKSYFAGRELDQSIVPISGGNGAGGSAIRVLTEDASLFGTVVTASGSLFTNMGVFSNTGEAIIEGVLEIGDITIHLNNGLRTKEYYMNLESYSYYELNVMMEFDYTQWLQKANIDSTDYSSLEDVFDDEEAVRELMLKHASADFLAFNVSANLGELDVFTANETAMKWIGLSDYLIDKLLEIEGVEEKLLASTYWNRYLKDSIPIMTSDTAPFGTVSSSGDFNTNYKSYYAFDGDKTDSNLKVWLSANGNASSVRYLQYEFTNPICVNKVHLIFTNNSSWGYQFNVTKIEISASIDGSTFEPIHTINNPDSTPEQVIAFENHKYYKAYRVTFTGWTINYAAGGISYGIALNYLQFYGRSLDVSVPSMTSNTSPYGEVIGAGNIYNGSLSDLYQPFSTTAPSWLFGPDFSNAYIGYEFKSSTIVKKTSYVTRLNDYEILTYKVQALNNNNVWEDIPMVPESEVRVEIGTYKSKQNAVRYTFDLDNHKNYLRYRFVPLTSGTSGGQAANTYANIIELKFYGISYSEKEFESGATKKWLYDHGVELDNLQYTSTAVNEDENLKVTCSVANSMVYDSVDLTNYSTARATGLWMSSSLLTIGVNNSAPPSGGWDSYTDYSAGNGNLPNNGCHDVSSFSGSKYVCFGSGGSDGRVLKIKELWLE